MNFFRYFLPVSICGARSAVLIVVLLALAFPLTAAELLLSKQPDRGAPVTVDSQPVQGVVYVFVSGADSVDQVRFYRDNALIRTENNAPWDMEGGSVSEARPFDTRDVADGAYALRAELVQGGNTAATLTATLQVANQPAPQPGGEARQLHLGWDGDPASTLSIMWFTPLANSPAEVNYRLPSAQQWQTAAGELRLTVADGRYLLTRLTGLLPDTEYEFRVALADTIWSKVYTSRTAPGPGAQDFDAVYVADTGLIGRADGLAAGTAEVIAEIAALSPSMVLLGGDYAYFDTDKRYGTLARTIAAWFDQMQPVAQATPMMPVYGNHEVLLGEGFDKWVPYFATPEGWNGRRMYSFNVGDVHFVAVYALDEYQTLPSDALAWLTSDLDAAIQQGQRWLIPILHAAPFSEGTNHPSALTLRAQLGPIFEQAGVQVVLTSHDQSYERTYPLVDVPATNTPTSVGRHCYDLGEGVTWLKISPGGKLSNISKGFSPWKSPVAPPWTVVRDNSRHHYAHLKVSDDGVLDVDIYGISGTGAPPWRRDRVRYTTLGCGPELSAQPEQMGFSLEPGETETRTVQLAAEGDAISFQVSQIPSWLSVTPLAALTPADISITADATGLGVGKYTAVLEISDGADTATWLPVTLQVGAENYSLWVADNSQRLSPQLLAGADLQGNRYIFTSPDLNVRRVRFYLDDPSATGAVTQTENRAPFDLAGTASDGTAAALDTTALADGQHAVGVRLDIDGGLEVQLSADFQVLNNVPQLTVSADSHLLQIIPPQTSDEVSVIAQMSDGRVEAYTSLSNAPWLTVTPASGDLPQTLTLQADASTLAPGQYQGEIVLEAATGEQASIAVSLNYDQASPYTLQVSSAPDRSGAVLLDGATVSGEIYVLVPALSGINKVTFYLDDPNRQGAPAKVEDRAPWDFAGTLSAQPRNAIPFDVSGMSGQHDITAVVEHNDTTSVIHAVFNVAP
ncbi:fibronectin type III domain-containing protein [Marinobacter sp. SBS5]|uniref:fibronectin type III domain-containing protein n=1 Tax=Marinobacter sp. SBS5 TaxID=3401754 RepID=UPI003AAD116B